MAQMIQIDETIISPDLFEEKFVCELSACKGICCVEGDAGAPLTDDEVDILEKILPAVWDDLSEKAKKVINRVGVSYIDDDNEPVTSIVNNRECVFTYKDNGTYKCAIEKAYYDGKIDFIKPISCALYPVRLQQFSDFIAVNVHSWSICSCARNNGKNLNVPVYKFLKKPLIRCFGEEWYQKVEVAANELSKVE